MRVRDYGLRYLWTGCSDPLCQLSRRYPGSFRNNFVVVGYHCAVITIEGNSAGVRSNPLGTGMTKWHSHTDHSLWIVVGDLLNYSVALFIAEPSALCDRRQRFI